MKTTGIKEKTWSVLRAFFVLVSGFHCGIALGQQQTQVGLKLDVDQRTVQVGDTLTVELEFKQLDNSNMNVVQEPTLPVPQHFDVRGTSSATQVSIVNNQTAEVSTTRFTLVATSPGDETLGPAVLIYEDANGKKQEIQSNVANVSVTPRQGFSIFGHKSPAPTPVPNMPSSISTVPDDQLRGIKPLFPEFLDIRLILCLVVAWILAMLFLWYKFGRSKPALKLSSPLGKEAQLRENWRKLADENLDAKAFCLALSRLIRECLQYRYGFGAVHSTTEEILKQLSQRKLTNDEKEAVEKCLRTCDRVLHAEGNLTGRDNLRSLASVLLPKVNKS